MKPSHDIASGRLDATTIADQFCDLHPRLTDLQAQAESARCLFCHDAPCIEACPTEIDIPQFIRKIQSGNTTGAAVDILRQNIMGATCANACPVEELCEQHCVRNTAEDKPVTIGRLQRYATDHLLEKGMQPFTRAADSGLKVAVVGAGPAGLACAHRLSMHGHQVDVFEAKPKAGGLNEYGLAAYKMVDERAAKEVDFILELGGIEIHYEQQLGRDISLEKLRQDYAAVFLGLGHNAVNRLGLDGEDVAGVINAVDYIERIRQEALSAIPVGRRVVVIGAGNTAIDIAVQMKKLGAEQVTMVYRRGPEQMGATWYEQELAQTNGVIIECWAQPAAVISDADGVTAMRFQRTKLNDEGRLESLDEHFEVPADMVFKAIGQHFDSALFSNDAGAEGLEFDGRRIAVDALGATAVPGVFAGGDCAPGDDLTVSAVAQGRDAAEAIHQYLTHQAQDSAVSVANQEQAHG